MIILYPTSYSKAKTMADVRRFLEAAPKQECNSKEAFAGLVLEFQVNARGPVGTLFECHKHLHSSECGIKVGGNMMYVSRDDEGNWTECEPFPVPAGVTDEWPK